MQTRHPTRARTLGEAPAFSLADEAQLPVALTDLTRDGDVVLVFYRGYWSPFCRVQLAELNKHYTAFRSAGARIVGISTDAPDDARKLREKLSLGFQLLSDPTMTVIKAYGVAMAGRDIAVPAIFIVDRRRAIVFRHIGKSLTDRPLTAKLLERVEARAAERRRRRHKPPTTQPALPLVDTSRRAPHHARL